MLLLVDTPFAWYPRSHVYEHGARVVLPAQPSAPDWSLFAMVTGAQIVAAHVPLHADLPSSHGIAKTAPSPPTLYPLSHVQLLGSLEWLGSALCCGHGPFWHVTPERPRAHVQPKLLPRWRRQKGSRRDCQERGSQGEGETG